MSTRAALTRVLDSAPITPAERRTARGWYPAACRHADAIAHVLDTDRETGAGILSAFSVRTSWAETVRDSWSYAIGDPVPGLRHRIVMADAVLLHGIDALRGPKTHAFARAIAGDRTAVVVDVWMCRAAGLTVEGPNLSQYRQIAADVALLARCCDEDPRTMQALIWGRVRGSSV